MTSPASDGERLVALAAVAGAHGIAGELRLKLFAATLERFVKGVTMIVGRKPLRLLAIKGTAKAPIVRFEGIADRIAAEALRGTLVEIERVALPALEAGEYYHADLVGLACFDEAGAALGTVVAVENYGAGDLLEVEREGGQRSLIPFREPIATLANGRITLDPDFLA